MPRIAPALCLLALAACAPSLDAQLGTEGVESTLRRYYDAHDLQEGVGMCLDPEIKTITRIENVQRKDGKLVLDLRYAYWDRSADVSGITFNGLCEGFATRTFTLDADTYQVLGASRPRDRTG
ncbi:MAG: hypothetical protein KDG89_12890 [Geminicoccaceae bacterium]|nr:hypothetical protein [Geminicoccaceae bacterium]